MTCQPGPGLVRARPTCSRCPLGTPVGSMARPPARQAASSKQAPSTPGGTVPRHLGIPNCSPSVPPSPTERRPHSGGPVTPRLTHGHPRPTSGRPAGWGSIAGGEATQPTCRGHRAGPQPAHGSRWPSKRRAPARGRLPLQPSRPSASTCPREGWRPYPSSPPTCGRSPLRLAPSSLPTALPRSPRSGTGGGGGRGVRRRRAGWAGDGASGARWVPPPALRVPGPLPRAPP